MLGYAISAPTIVGILNGCKASPELNYAPIFFSESQAQMISEISEIILPRTTTPGAIDAGVPSFIDRMIGEVYKKEDQEKFTKGLEALNAKAAEKYGDDFIELNKEKKIEFVKQSNDEALSGFGQRDSEGWWAAGSSKEKPFILTIKELTILGFFISEAGATQVLQYNQVPGPFQGCVSLEEVGKAWAT